MDLAGMKFFNTRHSFADGDNLLRSFAKLLSMTFFNEKLLPNRSRPFAVVAKADGLEDIPYDFFEKVEHS